MSDQVLDLRRFLQIVRRQILIVIAAAILGLLFGVGFTLHDPPLPASSVQVLLPPWARHNIGTQVVIARSDRVLLAAIPYVHPPVTLRDLHNRVDAGQLTSTIVSITAEGTSAAQAESTAKAVAESYIDYVGRRNSPGGKLQAEVLSTATKATSASLRIRLILTGLIGLLCGTLAGIIVAVAVGRNRHRLRVRSEIAAAASAPVLASTLVRRPSGLAGWTRLLEEYEPRSAYIAGLNRVLGRVGPGGPWDEAAAPRSLLILSLASDSVALAFGPQLATYAASLGVPTALVIAAQQDDRHVVSLRAACEERRFMRAGLLQLHVIHDGDGYQPRGARLEIITGTINIRAPRAADMAPATATMLAVSAGAATGGQLARVMTSCSSEGHQLAGVIVVNPDSADQTTGLHPQTLPLAHLWQPTRLSR